MEPSTEHAETAAEPGEGAAAGSSPIAQILKAVLLKRVEDAIREKRTIVAPSEPVPPPELQVRVARLFDVEDTVVVEQLPAVVTPT